MKRDWSEARAKVEREGRCRACSAAGALQAAHIVPRSRVGFGGEDPRNICPLCAGCHAAQHDGSLELLPLLSRVEQAYVVELVGMVEAFRRTTRRAA